MIYLLDPALYPAPGQHLEEIEYQDENDFTWKIARVQNGFFIRYFGDKYFQEKYFSIELADETSLLLRNTNCIFVADAGFDTFFHFRDILKTGWTDDIWDAIEEMLTERLRLDPGLLESEIVN